MRKSIKILVLVFGFLVLSGFGLLFLADLYTEQRIKKLGNELVYSVYYTWHGNPEGDITMPADLQLGSMLIGNFNSGLPDEWPGGDYDPWLDHENFFRGALAKNPSLAYVALNRYAPVFFKAFNESLELRHQEALTKYANDPRLPRLKQFKVADYWKLQRKNVEQYDLVVTKLLALPDATLKGYLEMVGNEQGGDYAPATEVQNWAWKQGLIKPVLTPSGQIDQNQLWNFWNFYQRPVDLILLTYRISTDFPQWTPRKFLTEVQKFSGEVKKVMPGGVSTGNTTPPTLSR